MTELALTAKEVVLRIDRGVSTAFPLTPPSGYDGVVELRIYALGSSDPVTVAANLVGGQLIFELDDSLTATLPRFGRYAVVWTDAEGEPRAIMKGQFYCDP